MTRLLVAVCTNREPEAVRETLEALAQQLGDGGRGMLVTSGLGRGEHDAHARAAGELGLEALAGPAGLSGARNAALHEADSGGTIAYLDDDAIPAPDWLDRLIARWDDAGPAIGCIGGRIVPRWSSPPPGWLSEALHPALSLLDLGPGTVELDPGRSDAYGANISFSVEALRRAGGFDPSYGAWRGVPLFGEESMVQRRLIELGYRVLYAGDACVEHIISPDRLTVEGIARRRFWFGAVSASPDAPGPLRGAIGALKASAGIAAARLRRDEALAAERRVRAAQGAGTALGPVLRRRLRRRGWPGRV